MSLLIDIHSIYKHTLRLFLTYPKDRLRVVGSFVTLPSTTSSRNGALLFDGCFVLCARYRARYTHTVFAPVFAPVRACARLS